MKPVDIKQLSALIEPVVAARGYELVDVEWTRQGPGWVVRVYIDLPGAGVTLEDCARVSRELSPTLDVSDLIHIPYTLEVSSPGLDRPLKKEADFRRFVGKKAKIRTRHAVGESRRNFSGVLLGVEAGKVRIDVGDATYDVPLGDVERAHLVVEL